MFASCCLSEDGPKGLKFVKLDGLSLQKFLNSTFIGQSNVLDTLEIVQSFIFFSQSHRSYFGSTQEYFQHYRGRGHDSEGY
jgi:hypothetical protein